MIARHGKGHKITPTHVNNMANIQALKDEGVTHIIATTAVGSLNRDIRRGDIVLADQFIDFTKHRKNSFVDDFEDGINHAAMPEPTDKEMRKLLFVIGTELGLRIHRKGTVVTIEGPRLSTKAESRMFQSWGADIINMSIAPEAALANEAKIPYAVVAMSTDYDCCFDDIPAATWEDIIKVFEENSERVKRLILAAIPRIGKGETVSEGKAAAAEKTAKLEKTLIDLRKVIRTIPDFPKKGVMFRDITTLLLDPEAYRHTVEQMIEKVALKKIDKIVGIESRGFIFGGAMAFQMGIGFVPCRKAGKLPGETVFEEYELEYGKDKIEMHKDAISEGDRVLIIDDLIATGGTAKACANLVEKMGGTVESIGFVIGLPDLGGIKKLDGYPIFQLVDFEGD